MVLLLTVVLNIFVVVAWKAPPNLFEYVMKINAKD